MIYRPRHLKLKDVLVGDIIIIPSIDSVLGVEQTVGGMATAITRAKTPEGFTVVTLGRGYRGSYHENLEVRLRPSLLRDEGIAIVVGGSPTLNVYYVRVRGYLYRVTYDWTTDKTTRTLATNIPAEEQRLESLSRNASNRESKILIAMDVPLTDGEVVA